MQPISFNFESHFMEAKQKLLLQKVAERFTCKRLLHGYMENRSRFHIFSSSSFLSLISEGAAPTRQKLYTFFFITTFDEQEENDTHRSDPSQEHTANALIVCRFYSQRITHFHMFHRRVLS